MKTVQISVYITSGYSETIQIDEHEEVDSALVPARAEVIAMRAVRRALAAYDQR